ncbi:unnamed protein product [Vitrella brassicaformis CCMP3155]|uniref:peptidylprolyl isomerase n=2 Tax=Vitrella brassicaformis TaxID=1169539 RepID=A0A0G4EH63_VITBC|nr:unnamed protein product [Vitrella brassicaformis CCMP3155]|eukprot:CEL95814.1 unnamed protein product [Vitrella brassicaformis CCMP3155]
MSEEKKPRRRRGRNPRVFMDVSIGTATGGRIVFELYADVTPRTAENFRGLCTGEYGASELTKRPLHFLGCRFFKVLPGFIIQAGDLRIKSDTPDSQLPTKSGDPEQADSIYEGFFRDENFSRRHSQAGVLSMANKGRNTNASEFFITLKRAQHLDGKHVAFGQVTSGMEVVRAIAKVPTDKFDRPRVPVVVVNCGELDGDSEFGSAGTTSHTKLAMTDPLMQFRREMNLRASEQAERLLAQGKAAASQLMAASDQGSGGAVLPSIDEDADEHEDEDDADMSGGGMPGAQPSEQPFNDERSRRLFELKMKMNQSRKLNNREVLDEKKRQFSSGKGDAGREGQGQGREADGQRHEGADGDELGPINMPRKGKEYLMETAAAVDQREEKKRKKNDTFGWNVFNQDASYRAHKKRVGDMAFQSEDYDKQRTELGDSFYVGSSGLVSNQFTASEQSKQKLVQALEQQEKKRKGFSRHRTNVEDEDVSYINKRNKIYNKKLERHFGEYSRELKQNLERGTAL